MIDARWRRALLPPEPRVQDIARELYEEVSGARILSPHGHVPAELLATDRPFGDPAELLLTGDHYLTRLLFASGADFADFGRDPDVATDPRRAWATLADTWFRFAGTASAYWLTRQLSTQFGIDEELGPDNADRLYDLIADRLRSDAFRPRRLYAEFGVDLLATTDDPLDDLDHHRTLARDGLRVVPTFRPDALLDPARDDFAERVDALLAVTGRPGTFAGYLVALRDRRAYFVEHGAVSADHGVDDPFTADLGADDAARLFDGARRGGLDATEQRLLRGHLLFQMARMSVDDGLVMTIHAGVRRNHHPGLFARYGADTGHDIPLAVEFTDNLRPLLAAFGTAPGFHVVVFALDEGAVTREIAPLAACYPSVYVGAPWWFLDAPDAALRIRDAVTETVGFYRGSGFVDDTRAFLSIPARHDMARRIDAAHLARLVAQERMTMSRARMVARDLVDRIPREAFKL